MTTFSQTHQDLFFVAEEEAGIRIDKILAAHYPLFSRTYFQKLLEEGLVLMNGLPVKKRNVAEEDDEIEVCFQFPAECSLEPESIPLSVLYEDNHLLAINKPAGMVVHPAPGHPKGTFVNALLAHCKSIPPSGDPLRPGIVHRLDKDTSGVLLAAKTPLAHQRLVDLFSSRKIAKTYLAICLGHPTGGEINAPLGRHPVRRKEMAIMFDGGKEAISEVRTLAFNQQLSLVLIRPKTGRTHQIRVHLKHIGCPILGDSVYGSSSTNQTHQAERQMLHAYQISFTHPITNELLTLTAPLPNDLKNWMKKFSTNESTAIETSCQ
jgi:23S rRNA pseudouridine1911/1915/1917 synthase